MNDGLAERKPKPKTSAAVANRMRSLDGDEDRQNFVKGVERRRGEMGILI